MIKKTTLTEQKDSFGERNLQHQHLEDDTSFKMESNGTAHVKALVLDATPLITQPYNHYQNYAASFYTTPTVLQEIKDERARKNLEIWKSLGTLQLRHPTAESIKRVSAFAKATGDYSVLSANDIHILALTYELETELNQGDWRLRKLPGDSLDHLKPKIQAKDKIEEKIQEKTEEPKKKRIVGEAVQSKELRENLH